MGTFLFNNTVFGPVVSRRLGSSLGINLLPDNKKVCNFNCIYCECGLTPQLSKNSYSLPSRIKVNKLLEEYMTGIEESGEIIDTITFAGNGEPTLHPDFSGIIDDVIKLRKKYLPAVKIAVLSNATLIHQPEVFKALLRVDYNILKLDTVFEDTHKLINCPLGNYPVRKTLQDLKKFSGKLIIQTMFFRGNYNGIYIDNTANSELEPLIEAYREIRPESVMIYTIARDTPHQGLQKAGVNELKAIAARIEKLGIKTHVSG
jgi:wyosine [tRNA(Phe)-imidazoG37] synthetase (radical SAM superfamily)